VQDESELGKILILNTEVSVENSSYAGSSSGSKIVLLLLTLTQNMEMVRILKLFIHTKKKSRI